MSQYTNPISYKDKQYVEIEIDIDKAMSVFKAMDRRLDLENKTIVFGYRKLVQPEVTDIAFDDINWTQATPGMSEEELEELSIINKEVATILTAEIAEEEKRLVNESKMVFVRQGHYDYKTHSVVDYPEVV